MRKVANKVSESLMVGLWVMVLIIGTALDSESNVPLIIEACLTAPLAVSTVVYNLTK